MVFNKEEAKRTSKESTLKEIGKALWIIYTFECPYGKPLKLRLHWSQCPGEDCMDRDIHYPLEFNKHWKKCRRFIKARSLLKKEGII